MLTQPNVFSAPLLGRILRWLAVMALWCTGWRVVGERPVLSQFVLIGAPHTSNWDFPLMLMAALSGRIEVHWMGKHTLFRPPFGRLMRWLGGISVDRGRAANRVQAVSELFRCFDELVILIAPEGTRGDVTDWKTGFYHIAHAAGVPIVLGYIDADRRECGFGPVFYLGNDVEDDMRKIRRFYVDKSGLRSAVH